MRISDWSSDVCSSDLAQRIGELGQEGVEAFGEGGGERCERGAPRGVVTLGLGVEREQPRPAIGALESGGVRATQEGAFARDLFGDEHFAGRSEEHTSELQSLMRTSYAVFCLKKKNEYQTQT